ncbi:MAG TPA: glucoamylase family protein [Candidatus Saccharimonadales bacterium]|nr:glucoamylase family protein [Candidatus Saccharimonadales bacterium]
MRHWSAFWFLFNASLRLSGGTMPLTVVGHDSRIDLTWQSLETVPGDGWNVYRSDTVTGPSVKVNAQPLDYTVYSDYLGRNDLTRYYRVALVRQGKELNSSSTGVGISRLMSEEELLTSVQEATFRYFWDYAHPVSGLAREALGSGDKVTIGGSGFGIMALIVGAERGFISRPSAAARLVKILRFLEEKASRYHGAWSHWLDGSTGRTLSFSKYDDGGDLVETAFLIQGLLTARQYFMANAPLEREIRTRASRLWAEVEWNWYLGEPKGQQLFWHWSPNHGWKIQHKIGDHFDECLITYLLAIASPTHPIPPSCYTNGWAGPDPAKYVNGNVYFGIRQPVGWPMGGPMFFTHYSFVGFDPRLWRDPFCNYFQNNQSIARIHHAYAVANPGKHKGYGPNVWGLSASRGPDGYRAFEPRYDEGTVAPTAAIASMPYTPRESMAALNFYYHTLGKRLWGDFGFKDAFNLDRDWYEQGYLAIDQGPIIIMIENYRTQLCWKLFMSNKEITEGLKKAGWTKEP